MFMRDSGLYVARQGLLKGEIQGGEGDFFIMNPFLELPVETTRNKRERTDA